MIDPETARQAAEAIEDWADAKRGGDCSVTDAGDALAGLVPQLLDQLAERTALADEQGAEIAKLWLDRAERAADQGALGERCRALESENAQLLDQLAEWKDIGNIEFMQAIAMALNPKGGDEPLPHEDRLVELVGEVRNERDDARGERDAYMASYDGLGERCRQLETALGSLIGWIVGSDCYKHLPDEALKAARAALGDTPPNPTIEMLKQLKRERAVEPPQPETPSERDK